MSIGPKTKQDLPRTNYFNRAQYLSKVGLTKFFGDPISYLFYGTLSAMIAGLFFNVKFPVQLYIILGLLAIVKLAIFTFFTSTKELTITKDEPRKK